MCINCQVTLGLTAIILVLLLYIIFVSSPERLNASKYTYVGHGLGTPQGMAQALTSGVDLRRLGTRFTSTDQGDPNTVYNAQIKDRERMGVLRK